MSRIPIPAGQNEQEMIVKAVDAFFDALSKWRIVREHRPEGWGVRAETSWRIQRLEEPKAEQPFDPYRGSSAR